MSQNPLHHPVTDDGGGRWRVGCLVLLMMGVVLMGTIGMSLEAEAYCPSTNILTETFSQTCWECMFPLSLIGVTVMNTGEDSVLPAVGPSAARDLASGAAGLRLSPWTARSPPSRLKPPAA